MVKNGPKPLTVIGVVKTVNWILFPQFGESKMT